ncbi:MAG TPA: hypothetical protein VFH23_01110 [Jiangellaceae bacterium]|nr:hypothetical protein [Jiangellaceae bacterium]
MDQTTLIDGKGVGEGRRRTGRVSTFVLVSAFPESERGRFRSDG